MKLVIYTPDITRSCWKRSARIGLTGGRQRRALREAEEAMLALGAWGGDEETDKEIELFMKRAEQYRSRAAVSEGSGR